MNLNYVVMFLCLIDLFMQILLVNRYKRKVEELKKEKVEIELEVSKSGVE